MKARLKFWVLGVEEQDAVDLVFRSRDGREVDGYSTKSGRPCGGFEVARGCDDGG